MGEFLPCDMDRKPDGPPIQGYFPAAVTEEEWLRALAGRSQRKGRRGRVSERVNIFAGLIRDAVDGGLYYCERRQSGTGKNTDRAKARILVTAAATNGRGAARSFPMETFERAVLSSLREIDPRDVLPGDDAPDESVVLEGELARVQEELAAATAFMEANGFSATIGKRVTNLETRKAELEDELTEARARAACPAAAAWRDFGSLVDVLEKAPDQRDARLRLRAALRRVVEGIWLVVVSRGRDRLCVVQVCFKDGVRYRSYLVFHRPGRGNQSAHQPARWAVQSWAQSLDDEAGVFEGVDLRKAAEAARTAEGLLGMSQDEWDMWAQVAEPL